MTTTLSGSRGRLATGPARRLDALTSLRFFAAAAVVAYHVVAVYHPMGAAARITGPGFVGVTFFFVLSGFVLTWSRRADEPARRFYRHRFARVWPTHALTWALAVRAVGPSVGIGAALTNAALLQAWSPRRATYFGLNSVSWTLSCEAFFYVCFPLLSRAVVRTDRPLRALLLVLGADVAVGLLLLLSLSPATAFYALYVCPAYRIAEFVLGMLLARVLATGTRSRVTPAQAVVLLVAGVGAVALVLPVSATTYNTCRYWAYDLAALPGILLLVLSVACRDLDAGAAFLRRRGLLALGTWSFALYLTHQLVLRAVGAGYSGRSGLAVSLVVVVPVAWLAHRFWEHPAERALRGGSKGQRTPNAVKVGDQG